MDKWKYAEVRGALYSVLLKVDALAGEGCSAKEGSVLNEVSDQIQEALEILEGLQRQ